MKKATRDQGHENELAALRAIGTIGWLSTKQVGAWLYSSSNEHAATNKAARVLARLLAHGQVKKRDEKSETRRDGANFGVAHYVLTPLGAARADDEYCRPGLHLSQLDVGRQRVIVEFLTTAHWNDYRVIGAAGVRAGIANGTLGKRLLGADGLLLDPLDTITAILVVRNLHVELVQKAKRLANASTNLELLGEEWFVKNLKKILWPEDVATVVTATDAELAVSLSDSNE
jgi:hypothetical protein